MPYRANEATTLPWGEREREMSRMDRIRQSVVTKAMSTEGWWEEEPLREAGASDMLESGKLGRHVWRQQTARRRQIMDRLLDLSIQDPTPLGAPQA